MAANWTPISYDDDYLKNKSFTASDLIRAKINN